jgi:hypothetical protein
MMKKTVKPLTKLQQAQNKAERLECAIYYTHSNFDELFGLLRLYRDYIDSPDYNKYTAKNALNGIFTHAIHIHTALIDESGVEW